MEFTWFGFVCILGLLTVPNGSAKSGAGARGLTATVFKIWSSLESTAHRQMCSVVNDWLPTRFILYTRDHPKLSTATADQKGKIFEDHLDPAKEVAIIVHEFLRGCNKPFTLGAKQAYLKAKPGVQVVTVCWEAAFPSLESKVGKELGLLGYLPSTMFVPCVGDMVAKFLTRLHEENNVPWKSMSIASHSLGSQVSGDAGNKLGGKLEKIIALDPALPLYGPSPLYESLLRETSAKRVIVLHTSIGQFSMGTADFYANSSWKQPGCKKWLAAFLYSPTAIADFLLCNHSRSYELFIESLLNPKAFLATKCSGYLKYKMGSCDSNEKTYFGPDTEANGTFYFTTKGTKPYYKSTKKIR